MQFSAKKDNYFVFIQIRGVMLGDGLHRCFEIIEDWVSIHHPLNVFVLKNPK